jgi:threonyl-tRNA synthetase
VQPQRFDLKYMTSGAAAAAAEAPKDGEEESAAGALPPGYERPVMIHRAVLGSVERMIAILTEHFAGKWPFFLSPRQAVVVPVSAAFNEYAEEVRNQLHAAGFYCDVDASNRTLNKMVREAQLSQYNFILVVGKEEAAEAAVNVRTRDNEVHGKKTVEALLADFKQLLADHK